MFTNASPLEPGRPLSKRFVDFVVKYVFILNIPISILMYLLSRSSRAANAVSALATIAGLYFGLLVVPAAIAAVIASSTILVQKRHLFKRTLEIAFVFLYLLSVLSMLVGMLSRGR